MKILNICAALMIILALVSCGESAKKDSAQTPDTNAINKIVMDIQRYSDGIQPDSDKSIMTIDNGSSYHYASAMFVASKFVRIMENVGNKQAYSDIYYTFKSDDLIHVKEVKKQAAENSITEKNTEFFFSDGNLIFIKDFDNQTKYVFDKNILIQSDKYKKTFTDLFKKAGV